MKNPLNIKNVANAKKLTPRNVPMGHNYNTRNFYLRIVPTGQKKEINS